MNDFDTKTIKKKNGSIFLRATIWKVIGQIAVALLGLGGVALGLLSQSRTSDTNAVLEETVGRLDKQVIPAMKDLVDELRKDNKTLAETIAGLRERTARIEGRLDPGARMRFREVREPPPEEVKLDKMVKKAGVKSAIPDMNYQKIQTMAQEKAK